MATHEVGAPKAILPLGDAAAAPTARVALRSGGVMAYPTDTFYALGVDPFRASAVSRLYRLKEREEGRPVLLLIGEIAWAHNLWGQIPVVAERLMAVFWPGPLTIVAPPGPRAPAIGGGGNGLALRLPGDPAVAGFIRAIGFPVTGTSANPSGSPPARSAADAAGYFGPALDLLVDGGVSRAGQPSTVVSVEKGGVFLVRQGMVPWAEIQEIAEKK